MKGPYVERQDKNTVGDRIQYDTGTYDQCDRTWPTGRTSYAQYAFMRGGLSEVARARSLTQRRLQRCCAAVLSGSSLPRPKLRRQTHWKDGLIATRVATCRDVGFCYAKSMPK
jgi:hypothetical protein